MAYSRVVAVGNGITNQFTVNFALDYLLEADVTCRVGTEIDGSGEPVYRTITFLSTNLVQISGAPPGNGVQVLFDRTVDKSILRVDYNNGDQLDEDNLMIAQKQAMMAVHEVLDGKYTSDADAAEAAAIATAQAAVATAERITTVAAKVATETARDTAVAAAAAATAYPASIIAVAVDASAGAGGNDYAALQAAVDAVRDAGGGMVILRRSKVYRAIINMSTPNLGLVIWPKVTLILNGSAIHTECDGSVYGLRNLGGIVGHGNIECTVSTNTGLSGIYHSAISVGEGYSNPSIPGNLSAFASPSKWFIRDVSVKTARPLLAGVADGYVISIVGDASNGLIDGVTVLDNSTSFVAIGMDWGIVGPISASPSTIGATRTAFDNGTAYTTHPHDIEVRRVKIGSMSAPNTTSLGSIGIRLSGVYNILFDGINIDKTTFTGIYNTAGDCGFEFAPAAVKPFAHKGIQFKNITMRDAGIGWGVFCEMLADNIAIAVTSFAYVPRRAPINRTDILFENIFAQGVGTSSTLPGFRFQQMIGGEVRNCTVTKFNHGIIFDAAVDETQIIGGRYYGNNVHGIYEASSDPAEDLFLFDVHIYGNGVGGGAQDCGIKMDTAKRPTIFNCRFGTSAETTQDRGIWLDSPVVDAVVENNYVDGAVAFAYVMGTLSTDFAVLALYHNNRARSTIPNKYAGVSIVPYSRIIAPSGLVVSKYRCTRSTLTGNITPPSGTWTAGSTFEFTDPAASTSMGSVCVTAGTVGSGALFKAMPAYAA